MKLFILTGELSGETHAARVLGELIKQDPKIKVKAMGSKYLEAFGAEIVVDYRDYTVSGFTEVLLNLGKIFKLKGLIEQEILNFKPDVLLLVDYAGFNLSIAETVRAKLPETKIIEYIAPQVWASRPWRINRIKKNVDKVLCTLPFEEALYKKSNIPVRFVGNPVACSMTPRIDKTNLASIINQNGKNFNLNDSQLIGLFPGSRKSEIKEMLPVMLKAAKKLRKTSNSNFKFVLAQAPSIDTKLLLENGLEEALEEGYVEILKSSLDETNNHKLLGASDILWLCSGTVTLEAAMYGTPYLLAYKGDWLSYQLYKFFKIIDMAGLANIIAGEYIVPEFLQHEATAENFIKQTLKWIKNDTSKITYTEDYDSIKKKLLGIKEKLTEHDTPKLVAEEIFAAIH